MLMVGHGQTDRLDRNLVISPPLKMSTKRAAVLSCDWMRATPIKLTAISEYAYRKYKNANEHYLH